MPEHDQEFHIHSIILTCLVHISFMQHTLALDYCNKSRKDKVLVLQSHITLFLSVINKTICCCSAGGDSVLCPSFHISNGAIAVTWHGSNSAVAPQ